MEHKTRDEIREVANILPRPLSKRERLELWAEALEREGGRRLRTLYQIEYAPPAERALGRADDSPLSVAFNNPELRAAGLSGDTIGDATAFFGINESELHDILCFCHYGETMSADVAATRVRAAATGEVGHRPLHASWFFIGASTAMLTVISGLRV